MPNESGDVTSDQDPECALLFIRLIHFMIEIKLPNIVDLKLRLINVSLKWIEFEGVSTEALSMLRTIVLNVKEDEYNILIPVVVLLPSLLLTIENGNAEAQLNVENNNRLNALVQLLRMLIGIEAVRKDILEMTKLSFIMKIFIPLLGNESPRIQASSPNTQTPEAVLLYVNTMALVNDLIKYDDNWIHLYTSLMQQKYFSHT